MTSPTIQTYNYGGNKIFIKNPAELKAMKIGGQILGQVLAELKTMVKPGATGLQLDDYAEKRIVQLGGKPAFKGYHKFPNTLCININQQVVHAIPDQTPFNEGDLISIDCGVIFDGLNTDAAISVIVGNPASNPLAAKMLATAEKALKKGIEAAKVNVRTNLVSRAIEKVIIDGGFSIVENLSGHGVGTHLHEDPYILNYEEKELGPPLLEGMTIAIEPIFTAGKSAMKTAPDRWTMVTKDGSLAIQIEHTIAITKDGPQILTLPK